MAESIIPAEHESALASLRNSRLVELRFEPIRNQLALTFRAEDDSVVRLVLRDVIQFNYSNSTYEPMPERPEDFYVGEVTLVRVTDGGQRILTFLHHQFVHSDNYSQVQYYPGVPLFYVHIDGEVMLDAVGTKYDLGPVSASQ